MVEGRPGKRRSHRWYSVPLAGIPEEERSRAAQSAPAMEREFGHPGPRTASLRDGGGAELVRLIGTGGQAVVPPSTHSSGERREWEGDRPGEPAVVGFETLLRATRRLARKCGWAPKAEAAAAAGGGGAERRPGKPVEGVGPFLEYRINRYLDEMPAGVSGQGGTTGSSTPPACWRTDSR